MDDNQRINYNISGRMKKSYEAQKSIVHVCLKKKIQLLDAATHTVVDEMESPIVMNSFPVEMSTLLLPRKLQLFVPSMLSSLHLFPSCLQELEESVTVSLRGMAEEVISTGHDVLEVFLDIEDLTEELCDEDEVVSQATTDLMDLDGPDPDGGFGATPAPISSIEEALRTEVVEGKDLSKSCMICLDEFSDGMEVKRMPCSHVFHGSCITRWLVQSNMCPLCRIRV